MKNLFCAKEHSCKSITLAEKSVRVERKDLTYRLLVMPKESCEFFVTLSEKEGVWLIKSLGNDLDTAKRIYALLVKQKVFSCHLSEIVEELLETCSERVSSVSGK